MQIQSKPNVTPHPDIPGLKATDKILASCPLISDFLFFKDQILTHRSNEQETHLSSRRAITLRKLVNES